MNDDPALKARLAELKEKYDLTYHIGFALQAQDLVGLKGKRVLEVGGSLPSEFVLGELGARQWVAVEQNDYWNEVLSTGNVTGTPPVKRLHHSLLSEATVDALGDHHVLFGGIESLPDSLASHFDVVFSIAAFEHIARLPAALEQMFKALRPGGKVFSLFAPIWSSIAGHHMPDITDQSGLVLTVNDSPIPPWGHLLYSPMQLFDLLCEKCDPTTAREIVYFAHHSGHINRFFIEDYFDILARSRFATRIALPQWPVAVPQPIQEKLCVLHPRHTDFSHRGVLMVLERPE